MRRWIAGSFVLILIASLGIWMSCERQMNAPVEPAANQNADMLAKADLQLQAVMEVQDRHTPNLMLDPNVVGTATGLTSDGRPAILIFLAEEPKPEALKKAFPQAIEEIPVVVEVTGVFRALKTTVVKVDHKVKQTPPIQLGTSGGWRYDLANGYCCGGTLGSLIQIGGNKFILSNYHVFEADIVSGGNSRVATTGDPIIQPGLIDVGCNANNAQNVATLVVKKSLPNNNVDASIAQIISGMVREDGSILEIGTLSAQTVAASLSQAVKKSGRTTALTRSTVSGLNATVSVAYENECAGGSAFTKTFTGQIVIKNLRSKFLAGGDSGSLLVQDVSTNPKTVGLLFAGSSTQAIANPIGQVLTFLGATMVGN